MPFQPGKISNPTGRARKTKEQIEFEKWCQEKVATEGKRALAKMLYSKDIKIVQWAVATMLDRGFGRPAEVLDVTNREELRPSPAELEAEIDSLIPAPAVDSPSPNQPSQGTA